jgi:hypothetical protein
MIEESRWKSAQGSNKFDLKVKDSNRPTPNAKPLMEYLIKQ